MNKIPMPVYDDIVAFEALSSNRMVSSYPNLRKIVPLIKRAYARYEKAGGNALKVSAVKLGPAHRTSLHGHYRSPPRDVEYITTLRQSTEHLACPMCGSFHRGTLDHLLPKNTYPEFSLYSRNLVPACKCNSKRKEVLIGAAPGERILHPYFDVCLSRRLIAAKFTDLGAVPKVSTRIVLPRWHPDYRAVAFHVRSVVARTAINKHFADRWSRMYRQPRVVVRGFGKKVTRLAQVRVALKDELKWLDDEHDGRNNWNSAFVAGLLEPTVCRWLYKQLAARGPNVNQPLGPLGVRSETRQPRD